MGWGTVQYSREVKEAGGGGHPIQHALGHQIPGRHMPGQARGHLTQQLQAPLKSVLGCGPPAYCPVNPEGLEGLGAAVVKPEA